MSNVEFKDIKCNFNLYKSFYAVAVLGSFSEAARSLYVSQPSLSYNVKQLEEQLNTNLFYRTTNGVSLTSNGKQLMEYIGQAFSSILQAEELIAKSSKTDAQTLVIGAPTHVTNFYLIDIINDIYKRFPNINIKILEKTSVSLKELIVKDMIDIVFDTSFSDVDRNLMEVKEIAKVNCCFAGTKEIMQNCNSIEDLSKLPFILHNVGGTSRKMADEFFANNNLKVTPLIEAYTTETILSLVRKGLGVGFFYEKSITRYLKSGELVKFESGKDNFKRTLSCAYLKRNSNPIIEFMLNEVNFKG